MTRSEQESEIERIKKDLHDAWSLDIGRFINHCEMLLDIIDEREKEK